MNLFPFDLSPFYLDGYVKYYGMTLIQCMIMHMVKPFRAEVSPFARFTFRFEDLKILNGLSATNYIFAAYADIIHTNIDIDLRYADIGHDIDSSYMILIMLIYLILWISNESHE